MRKKLLKLREELDQYLEYIEKKSFDIQLSKVNFETELNYKMDQLNYCPQQDQVFNGYLTHLNSRLLKPCENPNAEKVFDFGDDQKLLEIEGKVKTNYQSLRIRPQQGLSFTIGNTLPQPMKKILNKKEEKEEILKTGDQLLCVLFKETQGESQLVQWQIITGQDTNDLLREEMEQYDEEINVGQNDSSIPWENPLASLEQNQKIAS